MEDFEVGDICITQGVYAENGAIGYDDLEVVVIKASHSVRVKRVDGGLFPKGDKELSYSPGFLKLLHRKDMHY